MHSNDIKQTVISREHIEAVSDKLTSEKLASIKTKIRTRKRGTIADTDIIHGTFSYYMSHIILPISVCIFFKLS